MRSSDLSALVFFLRAIFRGAWHRRMPPMALIYRYRVSPWSRPCKGCGRACAPVHCSCLQADMVVLVNRRLGRGSLLLAVAALLSSASARDRRLEGFGNLTNSTHIAAEHEKHLSHIMHGVGLGSGWTDDSVRIGVVTFSSKNDGYGRVRLRPAPSKPAPRGRPIDVTCAPRRASIPSRRA